MLCGGSVSSLPTHSPHPSPPGIHQVFMHNGLLYCFHTARWLERWITSPSADDDKPAHNIEDHENLGVQVLIACVWR
jgi:hypothetical protein